MRPTNAELDKQLTAYCKTSSAKQSIMSNQTAKILYIYVYKLHASEKEWSRQGIISFFNEDLAHLSATSMQAIMFTVAKFLRIFGYIAKEDYDVLTGLYRGEYKDWSTVDITEQDVASIIQFMQYRSKPEFAVFTYLAGTIGCRLEQALTLKLSQVVLEPNNKIAIHLNKQKQNKMSSVEEYSVKRFFSTHKIGEYSADNLFLPFYYHRAETVIDPANTFLLSRDNTPPLARTIQRYFKTYSEITHKQITPHSLRHFVGHRVATEHGILKAAALLDHTNAKTTQKYINPSKIDTSAFI